MNSARIGVRAATGRASIDLSSGSGELIPRLLSRTPCGARVALVAGRALVLGGDTVSLQIEVGAGCTLELVEVGGTVAYDADGQGSSWGTTVSLGPGSTLIWRGLETVISDGANLHRRTDIRMANDARALIREVMVLGRSGERGGQLLLETSVTFGESPLLVESLDVRGDRPQPGILSDHRVLESVLIAGIDPDLTDEKHTMELAGPGALARSLGSAAHGLSLEETWNSWHTQLTRRP